MYKRQDYVLFVGKELFYANHGGLCFFEVYGVVEINLLRIALCVMFSLIVMTYTFLLQRLTNSPNQTNITSVMMKNKQETIEKIKQAALEEFYANGYAKASLRTCLLYTSRCV